MSETSIPEPQTFTVTAGWLPVLDAKFAALARRAAKIGVDAPTYRIVDTTDVPEMRPGLSYEIDGATEPTGRIVTVHTVAVTGDAPKYDGWTMAAVIDRDLDEHGPNVVHLVGSTVLDSAWRTVGDVCDHCQPRNIARGRKLLVVVRHDDGDEKIVGTTCLHDFLGSTSPQAIAGWISSLSTLADLLGQMDTDDGHDLGSGPRGEHRYDPQSFLARVAASIETIGWTSRGQARDDYTRTATVDTVVREIADQTRPTYTDEHVALATAALDWATDLDPGTNDYLNNVAAVAAKSGWRGRDLGLGGSIISAYQRELDRHAERAAEAVTQTAPCPSGRTEITGTIVGVKDVETDYGVTTKITVLDDRGFKVYGTAAASLGNVDRGQRVTFTAKVDPKDATFGFYSRPTKASVIDAPAAPITTPAAPASTDWKDTF